MAAVGNAYAENSTLRYRTGSTEYANSGSTSGADYIPAADLDANTKYLLICKALLGGDNVNGRFGVRISTLDDLTVQTQSEMIIEPTYTSNTELTAYQFVTSFSTDTVPADIRWKFATLGSASDVVRLDQMVMIAISLDDIGTDNYAEASDAGGTSLGTSYLVSNTMAAIAAGNLDADTEYLVLGFAQILVDDNKSNFHVALFGDNDADQNGEQQTYHGAEGEDTAEERMVGLMGRLQTHASGDLFGTYIRASADTANDYTEGYSYLIAIKTEAFEDFAYTQTVTGETVGTNTTLASIASYTPTTTGDQLVLGRYNYTVGGAASEVLGYLGDGSVGTDTILVGDSATYQTQNWDPTDGEQVIAIARESMTGANNIRLWGTTHPADTDATSEYEFLAVLSMELASTGTNYNEAGRAASFDVTVDSTDNADFLDNRSAEVTMTVASTDGASFSESLSALVEFTTSSTEGLSYEETDLAASVDITVASTDDAGFLDAVAAAIDLSSVAADTATLIDSASATADLTTSSTDDFAALEAAAALVDFTTAVTDALTYPETGLFALVDLISAVTDALTHSEVGLSVLVDLTTLSSESADFADELAALVEFTADSTDVYTGSGTNYDETGRSASFDVTATSTDTLGATESLSTLVDFTTASTEGIVYSDSVSALVDLTAASTDTMTGTDSVAATADLTTTSTDSVSFADELAATVDLTTVSSESVSFADSGSALVDLTTTSTDTVLYAELGRSALCDFTVDSSESHSVVEAGSATVDLTVDSSDSLDATDSVSALVDFTADSTDVLSGVFDETGRVALVVLSSASSDTINFVDSLAVQVDLTASSTEGQTYTETGRSAAVDLATSSTDILTASESRSVTVDLTVSSTDTATLTDAGRSALVEFTADVSHVYYGQFVTREQEDAGAGSGSSWQASLPVAPTAGNLLVVACAAGAIMTIDPSETTWIYAEGADIDNFALWYKIADGDSTDNDVDFSIASANQYGWVMAEYEAINGWKTAPLDQKTHDGVNSGDASSQTSGTTATTAQDEELLFAIFRLRDDDAAISGDALTNDFGKVDSAGTEFGNAWSMEIYAADSLVHSTGTIETTLSWTSGVTGSQAGLIATFMPEKITYDETGRTAQVEFATASSEVPSYDETGKAAVVEFTTTSNDHKYSQGTYNETDRSALVELQAQVTDTLTAVESQSAIVELASEVTVHTFVHPVSGSGSVAGAPSSVPSATGASGVPSAALGRGLPSTTGRRGTPGAAASEVQD